MIRWTALSSRLRWGSTRAREDFWTGLLCLSPALLLSLVFVVVPLVYSLYLSLHEWSILLPERRPVGLDNYGRLLQSAEFWQAWRTTTAYTVGVVPAGSALSLLLALLLGRTLRGRTLYRAAYFMPVATSTVAAAVIWTWLFNSTYGPINSALRWLGLPAPAWLADPHWALPALIVMSIWRNTGYYTVIFMAGLQTIPEAYYEAARIDGAGGWSCFRHVTWPLLRPTTAFVLVSATIFSYLVFGPIYVMTGGGPMQSTTVVVYLLYQRAFEFREMGYASAMAWALFVPIALLSLIQFRLMRARGEAV